KIGARQVIEDHLDLEVEQIAQAAKEFHFDTFFARQQLIERAIPWLEPVEVYPNTTLLLPVSQDPLSVTSTDKIALQPLGQCMLAARTAKTIGHQPQHSICQRKSAGLWHRACFGTKPSRMLSRPNSRHKQRATSIGPQQAARVASMGSAQLAELDLIF